MSSAPMFPPRVLIGWIAAAAVTFACSLLFMTSGDGDKSGPDMVGPSTFSQSAVGYAGIAEILRRLDVSVVKSRYNAAAKLSAGSVLVLAEPLPTLEPDPLRVLREARTALLILPKWQGTPSRDHKGWIAKADLLPAGIAEWAAAAAIADSRVVRVPSAASWATNSLGPVPTIAAPAQLVRSPRLRAIVASDDGILLGELTAEGRRLWVLADPDVLENHGLGEDGNAAFAVALVEALRGGDGAVVFDETLHGFVTRPAHPLKLLFELPFLAATVQGALAVALLLWATMARFGAPQPMPPALDAGKLGLVRNAASLLAFAGYQKTVVQRYVQATLRDVARQLHMPRGLSDEALVAALQRVGEARSVTVDCAAVTQRVATLAAPRTGETSPLLPIARDIHQWKREIMDGPGRNPRHR